MEAADCNYWMCPKCGVANAGNVERCPSCGYIPKNHQVDYEPIDEEGKLHNKIIEYLTERRWPYIHSRMDKKATNKLGTADFVVLAPIANTIVIEAKALNRKQEPDQLAFQILCERVGHQYYLIRSYEQFLDILKANDL